MLLFSGSWMPARASDIGPDYARLEVPNLAQATAFFSDMLGCTSLAGNTGIAASSALMECAQGSVIELVVVDHRPAATRSVRLRAEHPRAAAAWLRSRHLRSVGATVVRPLDGESDQVTIDLVTPWGQPLQLVGRTADASSTPRLAAE